MDARAPSGLFPAGTSRPRFREPHPVRVGPLLTGVALTAAWLLFFGLLATSARAYVWFTLGAAAVAWIAALALGRYGDRGVATGVAITTGLGVAVAVGLVFQRWFTDGWPLW